MKERFKRKWREQDAVGRFGLAAFVLLALVAVGYIGTNFILWIAETIGPI